MRMLVVVACLLAIAQSARADDYKKNYVGAQYINSRSGCRGFIQGVAPLGLQATCDRTDGGWRIDYGRYLTRYFGVEIGYQDAGEGKANGIAPNGATVLVLTAPLKAFDFVATARYPFLNGFQVVGRFGGARWKYDVNAQPAGFGAHNDNVTLTYGIGLEYRYFTAGFDVIHNVGQNNLLAPTAPPIIQDVQRWSVGLKYPF